MYNTYLVRIHFIEFMINFIFFFFFRSFLHLILIIPFMLFQKRFKQKFQLFIWYLIWFVINSYPTLQIRILFMEIMGGNHYSCYFKKWILISRLNALSLHEQKNIIRKPFQPLDLFFATLTLIYQTKFQDYLLTSDFVISTHK